MDRKIAAGLIRSDQRSIEKNLSANLSSQCRGCCCPPPPILQREATKARGSLNRSSPTSSIPPLLHGILLPFANSTESRLDSILDAQPTNAPSSTSAPVGKTVNPVLS
jgi:hypothetical protein